MTGEPSYTGDARTVVQSRHIGTVNIQTLPVPEGPIRLLPPRALPFANRMHELGRLSAGIGSPRPAGSPAVFIVSGLRGAGKTAMALHLGYEERARFPDGDLFVDFRGLGRREIDGPGSVAAALLRALHVQPDQIPTDAAEAAAHFRRRVADRRFFVLFDNVRLAAQVEDLIPPSEHAVVIITTENDLSGFAGRIGAETLHLGELDETACLDLLSALLDSRRVAADVEGAREFIHACGRWPLPVRIGCGRLKAHPHRPIGTMAKRLRHSPDQREALRVVSDATYADMPGELQRAYRLIGRHPGGDRPTGTARDTTTSFRLGAAAALIGCAEHEAEDYLDALIELYLVGMDGERYLLHDLVRADARSRTDQDGEAAIRRVIEWYLREAARADTVVNPDRAGDAFGSAYAEQRGSGPPGVATAKHDALKWLDDEHRNLRFAVHAAADRGLHELVWQLCEALWGLYLSRKHYDDWIATHELGLAAARTLDDPEAIFRVGVQLGRARYELRRFGEAHEILTEALSAARRTGNGLHEATALEFTGRAHLDAGETETALGYFQRSHALELAGGRTRGVAINLHHIARARLALGETGAAIEALREAKTLFERCDDEYNGARVLTTLGRVHLALGDLPEAGAALSRAHAVMFAEERVYQVAELRESLSEVAARSGDTEAAVRLRQQAIEGYEQVGSPKADDLRGR